MAYTWGSCEATCAVGQPDGCPAATGTFSTAVALNDDGSATTANIGEASFNQKFGRDAQSSNTLGMAGLCVLRSHFRYSVGLQCIFNFHVHLGKYG